MGFHSCKKAIDKFRSFLRPIFFPGLVLGALSFFCVFGCGANKITDDARVKSKPPSAPHQEELVEDGVVNPDAATTSPVDEESVNFSQLQQDIALRMAQSAAIPNDLVRQLLSLENRLDAFVELANRAGESFKFRDDLPYDPIANVIVCPQPEGPPLFAVFHRKPLPNGSFYSTGFSLIDSNGEFHKIYENANVAGGIFQDVNDDTVVDKVDDTKVRKNNDWYRQLTIVPMTKAPQQPALIIIMNPVDWTWRSEATDNPNIMKIHVGPKPKGPKPKEGEMMTPSATWVWDATQKSYIGPDGGIGHQFMRISARDYAALITPFIAQFAPGYPHNVSPPGVSKTLTSGPSPLTPALETIVGAFKEKKGQMINLREELATYRKDFVYKDFKALPSKKMLAEILEVKKKHLMMAFISLVDDGAVPCDEDIDNGGADCDPYSETVYALHIVRDENGRDRLAFRDWDGGMKLFGSMSQEVVFPQKASQVPVFEVHYEVDTINSRIACSKTVKVVEVYHLAKQQSITGKVFPTFDECGFTGEDTETKTKFIWVPSKTPGRVFLLSVSLYEWKTFDTSDDDDPDESRWNQVTCERTTALSIVTSDDVLEPSEKEIEEFRKSNPGLAKRLPDVNGETEKECRKIRNFGF
ncbi:MAG: hypothetical protein JXX14_02385 [Deltaproteobacteria bacterium]|nr:hypothetical protein [Deltaproteobacteria bacterium]